MPIVLKSGSLNLLEPSGPVQACNEIAFYRILDCDSVYFGKYVAEVLEDSAISNMLMIATRKYFSKTPSLFHNIGQARSTFHELQVTTEKFGLQVGTLILIT